ncbi:hypothetical protein L21SP2_0317 [Salinispira pacifica]|uniref:Uncharacterized protein n=2 Tax=Salinispira pacifica TaxID=1307761 RepID=V5WD82_9SPIO|nr:hypothetical protein L21SP2_0317 [Salinispira pacifica]
MFLLPGFALSAQDGGVDEDALFGGGTGESNAASNEGGAGSDSGSESGSGGDVNEDDLFGGSEDDMFGGSESGGGSDSGSGDGMIEEIGEPGEDDGDDSQAYTEFLTSEAVQIGGSLSSSLSNYWSWSEYPGSDDAPDDQEVNDQLGINLRGTVYLNARPSTDLRVYMKVKTSYPFSSGTQVLDSATYIPDIPETPTEDEEGVATTSTTVETPNLDIFEFYSDVNWNQRLFFRFGKQTVNWGVGYFWSPGDFISLVPIDPDDPEAEREGPVAIKASLPFGLNMIDAYLIGDETVREFSELGVAGKASLYLAPVEIELGAGYQKDRPFRVMSTARLPLRDITFFGEGRLSFGRQGSVVSDPGDLDVEPVPELPVFEEDDATYFSGTAGFLYLKSDLFESKTDLNLIAQYFFQGEGYDGSEYVRALAYGLSTGEIQSDQLGNTGRHYTALSLGLNQLFLEDLSLSSFWQANWSDMSGQINSSLTYRFFDGLSLSAGVITAYGESPSEYVSLGSFTLPPEFGGEEVSVPSFKNPFGDLAINVTVNLGGGRF